MEGNHPYRIPGHGGVIDYATRYLCRQGHTWVVVMESPRVSGALRLRHSGGDTFDARFELLSAARRACPDASILTIDGALDWADYEWRLDVRAVVTSSGDLGSALHRELSRQPAAPPRAPARRAPRLAPVPLGTLPAGLGPAAVLLSSRPFPPARTDTDAPRPRPRSD